jgi:penicillin-binding protein 2
MKIYDDRKFVILGIFLIIGIVFVLRLFYIQVIDESYKLSAKNQALQYVTEYPARGLVYDKNGELLVFNQAAYDLMVTPRLVKEIDTIEFCKLLNISIEQFVERMKKATVYSRYKASSFEKQIPAEQFASISERLYKYPGFFEQKRTIRKYPMGVAGHVLGYVSEVDNNIIQRNPYYKRGDYIGVSGLEAYYEKELRGERGVTIYMKDVHNRIKGKYKDGKYDTLAVSGKDLITTIDLKLQAYGEKLMQNKKGSIVAIDPSTGEILAFISSPSYDPNTLVGRDRGKHFKALVQNDSLKPLFNRALMAPYPPGSIFKLVQSLIALQQGVITENTGFSCNKSFVGCHNHPMAGNLRQGVQFSCNPYFYMVFKRIVNQGKSGSIFKDTEIGLAEWEKHMESFGLGKRLEIDLPNIKSGRIPGVKYYDKIYGKGRWAFTTIYSISIGQGEVEVIPLQMANIAATIANRGYYITPHLVKAIGKEHYVLDEYKTKHFTTVDPKYFEVIADGMQRVVEEPGGTARRAKIDGITVCGKTGTAQNPHGEDHSVFIAFAPKDNPQIAISVFVENSGFGGTWAAPIASLLIEQYINGEVKRIKDEQRILEADIISGNYEGKKKHN